MQGPKARRTGTGEAWKRATLLWPVCFKRTGYRTIHVGKGHFGPRNSEGENPANLGFDVNIGGAAIGQPGSYYGLNNFTGKGKTGSVNTVPGLEKYHGKDIFLTEALTLEANAHVAEAVTAKKPFFLYFAQYAVHAPFNSDSRFAARYAESGKPAAAQSFATLIEGMDKSLGDVLAHLNQLGVAENTLILFLGDNGSDAPLGDEHAVACAAPLRGKKGSHYEGGMRVPFIAAWAKANPGNEWQTRLPIAAGTIQSQQAAVYDLFPTLLALVDIKAPAGHTVDGVRLDTLLSGKSDPNRTEKFLMHYPHAPHRTDYFTSYRNGAWKVIYHYFPSEVSENAHYQLYNLAKDPFEQSNLVTSEPGELKRMVGELAAGLEAQGALYPLDQEGGVPVKPIVP